MSLTTRITVPLTVAALVAASAPALVGVGPATAAPAVAAPAVAKASAPARQMRALWVNGFNEGMLSKPQVTTLVSTAKQAGVNALIVQATRRQDCLCNKSILPRATGTGPASYDPLAEVIAQAHRNGIEVHAWVTVGKMWSGTRAPAAKKHVYNTHGPKAKGAARWLDRRRDGTEIVAGTSFVDLGNPAVQAHIVATVDSLQRNYKVDGINLDYIRYPDHIASGSEYSDWGYSATSMARYRAATKTTGTPAPDDPRFVKWRQDQVTGLVAKVNASMKRRDPKDRLSVNAITYGDGPGPTTDWSNTTGYRMVLQDISLWARGGLVDTVVAMNYRSASVPGQSEIFTRWLQGMQALAQRSGRHFVSGNGLWINTNAQSVEQVNEARTYGLDWAGYAYNGLTYGGTHPTRAAERAAFVRAMRAGPFRADATIPAMPWKAVKR